MRRRHLISHMGMCSAALAGCALLGCSSLRPLRLAIHPWIGYETLRLARTFRWLSSTVELYETKDLSTSSKVLESGRVDAACLTLDEVLRVRAAGIALTVALVFDVSDGADAVLAKPGLRRLGDLAGKRIAVENSALGTLMLAKLLESAHLQAAQITRVDLPAAQHLDAWQHNTIDAVITYEPTATLLQRDGALRIFDSRKIPDTIFDVLAVRADRRAGQQSALHDAVAGHFRGLSHLNRQREDATYRIAATQGISPEEVRQAIGGVRMPSLEANQEYLSGQGGHLWTAAQSLNSLMLSAGLLAHEDPLDDLFSAQWLPLERDA